MTLTRYNPADPDPFLTEARAQVNEAQVRGRRCLLRAGGAAFWFVLWSCGFYPWVTFFVSMAMALASFSDFEAWLFARKAAQIALNFRSGIEE